MSGRPDGAPTAVTVVHDVRVVIEVVRVGRFRVVLETAHLLGVAGVAAGGVPTDQTAGRVTESVRLHGHPAVDGVRVTWPRAVPVPLLG